VRIIAPWTTQRAPTAVACCLVARWVLAYIIQGITFAVWGERCGQLWGVWSPRPHPGARLPCTATSDPATDRIGRGPGRRSAGRRAGSHEPWQAAALPADRQTPLDAAARFPPEPSLRPGDRGLPQGTAG
jgi:hypothetical protein